MGKIICILLFITTSVCCKAQYKLVDSFNIGKGLPSNFVYRTLADDHGFLWIATDKGVVRFDGKQFKVFKHKEGVPDNDVLQMVMDRFGKIWIACANNQMASFDETMNRFVPLAEEGLLEGVRGKKYIYLHTNGALRIESSRGIYFIEGKQIAAFPLLASTDSSLVFQQNLDGTAYRFRMKVKGDQHARLFIYLTQHDKILSTKELPFEAFGKQVILNDLCLYLIQKNSDELIKVYDFKQSPLSCKVEFGKLNNPYNYTSNFSHRFLNVLNRYDKNEKTIIEVNCYDKNTLDFLFKIDDGLIANWMQCDKQEENCWVSTFSGLYRYQKSKRVFSYLPTKYNNMFYSLAKGDNGTMYFGNESSKIIEIEQGHIIAHQVQVPMRKTQDWQRDIIIAQHKIFTFSDGGVYVNYNKEIKYEDKLLVCKTIYRLNDTIVLIGNEKGLNKLNTKTEKIDLVFEKGVSILSIGSIDSNLVYLGSQSGLYTYRMKENVFKFCNSFVEFIDTRIPSISASHDGLLWIGTASRNLYVIKDNKIISHINEGNGLQSSEINKVIEGKPGQIWLATMDGVSDLRYTFQKNSLQCKVQNISSIDGLTSNIVHQILYSNDTLFAATDKGISCIPASIPIPEIPIVITRIRINQKDTSLLSSFNLEPKQNNIIIDFSGVELNGYFDHAQYSQDEGLTWIDLEENNFRTEWQSGHHKIWFRAVDVNKHINQKITKLHFYIATPFYKSPWLWLSIALVILALSIYINTILTKRKQQKQIDELLNQQALDELEIQALKAQMNPHFVFNCLNSIKGFIYDEDFEKADSYLDKFATLLRNTLDYSSQPSISLASELNYIDTYLSLEQLRFGNKFDYQIQCEKDIAQNEIAIPAMLLQPYVENAIKHGVCNLDDGLGKILIKVYLAEEKLHIEIDDNGVGREIASELKQTKRIMHESKGTRLTQRRIELYHIALNIIDKKNEDDKALGTLIHLIIPIPLSI